MTGYSSSQNAYLDEVKVIGLCAGVGNPGASAASSIAKADPSRTLGITDAQHCPLTPALSPRRGSRWDQHREHPNSTHFTSIGFANSPSIFSGSIQTLSPALLQKYMRLSEFLSGSPSAQNA